VPDRNPGTRRYGSLGCLLLLMMLSACGHLGLPDIFRKETHRTPPAEEAVATADTRPETRAKTFDYSAERVQELETIAEGSPSPRARADAHYFLGWIFAYAENPSRDYDRALEEFQTYLRQVETENLRPDATSWVTVLTALSQYTHQDRDGHLDFSAERVGQLTAIAEGSPSPRARADAHYFLGRIFACAENPSRDYDQALKEFEAHLELAGKDPARQDAESWAASLRALKKQREEGDKARGRVVQLEKRVLEMEQDLEKLKDLDLWLENQKQDRR